MSQDDMFIDKIRFGNPSKEDRHNMEVKNYLTRALYEPMCAFPFPKNSSIATREELNMLLDYQKHEVNDERKKVFDAGLVPAIINICEHNGYAYEMIKKVTDDIIADVLPLYTALKYFYNRPRPCQLAYYFRLALFPDFSKFVSSPAYPSGHATLGGVICEVLGSRCRDAYAPMKELMGEIAETRLYMGVHYVSDNNFALQVAEKICENKDFRLKHKFDIYLS